MLRPVAVRSRLLPRLLLMAERTVLFVCVENAARSLMAEAFFNADPPDGWRARSGGTAPAPSPNARTGPMLRERGLSLPDHPPRAVTPAEIAAADRRITMGCLDSASCPARLRELPVEDWALPDPARLDDVGFRRVRDEIGDRVARLKRDLAPR
ncbi:MAG TPA: low molecular weight phosphatase family protein [Thermoplasmata archaeon]|nr:low molecular weight phosphatase family protein [Thermoplasmata archaeon]